MSPAPDYRGLTDTELAQHLAAEFRAYAPKSSRRALIEEAIHRLLDPSRDGLTEEQRAWWDAVR